MNENYTKQALPSKEYREMLGSAICVFNSNNNFIIENILRVDRNCQYDWHDLIDKTSGNLLPAIKDTITNYSNSEISELFVVLVNKRNRIIHSFQITDSNKEQILATKCRDGNQFIITQDYLLEFIELNEKLFILLDEFRKKI